MMYLAFGLDLEVTSPCLCWFPVVMVDSCRPPKYCYNSIQWPAEGSDSEAPLPSSRKPEAKA